ncbi:hypothetical protein F4V43_02155 [Paenibacillus spiritus]|uniref:Uncharacterized protein n=1 Tax=Paenibacillus spiritus TaxID=2496557 RepID=A0A5J5GH24_9BACL|nr:hypothetical protein [Paenibacillus spiritus]KAA9007310.1 hypothetical protein F4V43_02155 [Paenibacillus spiritus]
MEVSESLSQHLNISLSATAFWSELSFLFPSNEEQKELLFMNFDTRRDLQYFLSITRAKKRENAFKTKDNFLLSYKESKKTTIEQLFQQPLNDFMTNQWTGTAEDMWSIHSKDEEMGFMDCVRLHLFGK